MKPKKAYTFLRECYCYGHHHLELKETETAKWNEGLWASQIPVSRKWFLKTVVLYPEKRRVNQKMEWRPQKPTSLLWDLLSESTWATTGLEIQRTPLKEWAKPQGLIYSLHVKGDLRSPWEKIMTPNISEYQEQASVVWLYYWNESLGRLWQEVSSFVSKLTYWLALMSLVVLFAVGMVLYNWWSE